MSGERYSNGLLEGFLHGRGQLAMGHIIRHIQGDEVIGKQEFDAWQDVVTYASDALSEYQENGDSEEVKRLTGEMMDATDKALALSKAARAS